MRSLFFRTAIICVLTLSATTALAIDVTRVVKDVTTIGKESDPEEFVYIAPYTYFVAEDSVYGNELWRSDGTEEGTQMVIDLRPGPNGSEPYDLTEFNGMLYFSATDGIHGREVWKTDGTEKGTVMVKDIDDSPGPAAGDGPGSRPHTFTVSNGVLFFSASDTDPYLEDNPKAPTSTGEELWKTDGTADGTVLVADIQPGPFGSEVNELVDFNGTLFFTANVIDPNYYYKDAKGSGEIPLLGRELWKSDGTELGTELVRDIYQGANGSDPQELTVVGSTLFFRASNGHEGSGSELWKTDGTQEGTTLVKDIYPDGSGSNISNLTSMAGILYFAATDAEHGRELWRSDGTKEGTYLVKDVNTQAHAKGSNASSNPGSLEVVGSTLFFNANDGVVGRELWKTDGTELGTQLVRDIASGVKEGENDSSAPQNLTNVGGTLFFSATSAGSYDHYKTGEEKGGGNGDYNGRELWKSDGTEVGTVLVKAINPPYGSQPYSLFNANGTLYFAAADAQTLHEPWTSDGTSEGTVRLKDINQSTADSSIRDIVRVSASNSQDRQIAFALGDQTYGSEPWQSNGKEEGTNIIRDIVPGKDHSVPADLTTAQIADGKTLVFFTAINAPYGHIKGSVESIGRELYVSDLTSNGTHLVKEIRPGSSGSSIQNLIAYNNLLFFSANDGESGQELYRSDGTKNGTFSILDIFEGSNGSSPAELTISGGILFFRAFHPDYSDELWSTDGTKDNTGLVKNIAKDDGHIAGSQAQNLTDVNGTLFFSASENGNGIDQELWKSDNTEDGTVRVHDIYTGLGSSNPSELVNVNGTLFFRADDGSGGAQLWKSDGEAATTKRVKTVYAPPSDVKGKSSSGVLHELTNVDGTLFFVADDGIHGTELWKSDGTEKGTVMVADLAPGEESSFPENLTEMDGFLYFEARDGGSYYKADTLSGKELWRTDGTEEGIVLVKEFWPGEMDGDIDDMTPVNGMLFFGAEDPTRGEELWTTFQAPIVSFINIETAELTNDEIVGFTVRFDETVGDVVASDFAIDVSGAKGGVTGASVIEVLGSGPSRTVNVNTGTGDGPISIDFNDNDNSVTDEHGFTPADAGAASFTDGASYTIDKTAPVLEADVLATMDSSPALMGTVDDPEVEVTIRLQGQTLTADNLGNGRWELEDNAVTPLPDGIYTVNLEAEDSVGNRGVSTGILQLTIDTTPPVITLVGDPGIVLIAGVDTYNEPGATAEDNIDPGLKVVIGGDTVDDETPGLYIVTYTATDSVGNSATISRTVLVSEAVVDEGEGEGAGGGDDQLCVFLPNIEIQLLSFVTEFSVTTEDFDLDELPEFFAIDLEGEVVCANEQDSLWQATVNAFAINLTIFDGDDGAEGLEEFREVIAALMGISQATQLALLEILDDGGFVLEGEYVSVACETGLTNCTPAAGPGKALFDEFEVLEPGQKGTTEPYSGPGDIDNDGTSNADEYANTVTAGGGLSDFISAVLDPTNDGSEIAGTGGCGASSNISFTASRGDLFLLAMVALMLAIVRRLMPRKQR